SFMECLGAILRIAGADGVKKLVASLDASSSWYKRRVVGVIVPRFRSDAGKEEIKIAILEVADQILGSSDLGFRRLIATLGARLLVEAPRGGLAPLMRRCAHNEDPETSAIGLRGLIQSDANLGASEVRALLEGSQGHPSTLEWILLRFLRHSDRSYEW